MALAQACEVFTEDHVEPPVKAVLDAPMGPHRQGQTGRSERGRGNVIAPFDRLPASDLAGASTSAMAASVVKRYSPG